MLDRTVAPTSYLTRPRTYGPPSILDYDRGRPLLRPDVIGGGKRAESQTRGTERPSGSGLSGGSGFPYGVTTSSVSYLPVSARDQGVTLTQKKSNSQSDLARDFSSLRTSLQVGPVSEFSGEASWPGVTIYSGSGGGLRT